ncbi:conjugative transfer signal peptidase TraF [Xanthomonas oryzae]|uniref:conjugative transfer signal peptidase TraF n=1 Tax=Xanthomonas oryzae TaxID=347 RepID=UPI000CA06051|nr:conjugative transfer signal peptidase TraF [Xanthomonas oryzae]PNR84163.1 conjugal transfer protein TraF [Xanthomonas oryzae pv. oryzae]
MKRVLKRVILSAVVAGVGIGVVGGALYACGARINTSKSIPLGMYWTSNEAVAKGEYVIFCPPQRRVFEDARDRGYIGSGFCPGGYGYMMKKVLAVKGDTVSVTPQGVTVNGELLPYSNPMSADAVGQSLPRMSGERYTLGESELLLMTDRSATSFDARYFGTVTRKQVKSVIRPVFTWY